MTTTIIPTLTWRIADVVTDDGVRISFKLAGRGPIALIFVHGWASTKDYFDLVATALDPERFRLISLDLRGHGQSEAGVSGFAPARHAHDILTVANAAGAQSFITVGHSMGAKYSECLPAIASERVLGQILVAGAPSHTIPITDAELARWADLAGDAEQLYHAHAATMSRVVAEDVRRDWAARAAKIDRQVLHATLKICFRSDVTEALAGPVPTLILAGKHDPFFPPSMFATYAARYHPGAIFEILDCGHEIPLELPVVAAGLITCCALATAGAGNDAQ